MPHRTTKAIQKCSPPILVFCGCYRGSPWLLSHLLSLSLDTPSGRWWPSFWYPGQCSSGNVIAVSLQDMSDPSPSQYPYLHWQWQLIGQPVRLLIWDLVWPENTLYLPRAFPVKCIQVVHVCSCDSPHLSAPYSKMATTLVLNICSLVLELYSDNFLRGCSVAKALLARASFHVMSASVPPCLSNTAPR